MIPTPSSPHDHRRMRLKAAAPVSTVPGVVQRDFMDLRDDLDDEAPPWPDGQRPRAVPAAVWAQCGRDVAGV